MLLKSWFRVKMNLGIITGVNVPEIGIHIEGGFR